MSDIPAAAQDASERLLAGYEAQRARIAAAAEEAVESEKTAAKPAVEAAEPVLMRDLGSMWT